MKHHRNTTPAATSGGFTLIELLVVIAIIGVFASVTLVATVSFRERAQASRVEQEVASLQKAAAIYFSSNQSYPDPENSTNWESACYGSSSSPAQKCCVSQNGCVYSGTELDTLSGDGDFASGAASGSGTRWLSYLGERAEAVLGGVLPTFLTEAPVSAGGNFKGVFYDCLDVGCSTAAVYFSTPKETCSRGEVHNNLTGEGICEQYITGVNIDGSDSYDS